MSDEKKTEQEESDELLAKLTGWYEESVEASDEACEDSEKDRDYYDGVQWTAEEVAELEKRGQPVLTFNRVAPKINYLLGDEVLKRVSPRALPRKPSHEDSAEAVADALRAVCDKESFDETRSSAFEDFIIEGRCAAVVEVERVESEEPIGSSVDVLPGAVVEATASEILSDIDIKIRHIDWDRTFVDPHARRNDYSDARYMGCVVWMDLGDAKERYPEAGDVFEHTERSHMGVGDTFDDTPRAWYSSSRKRVKIVELYWRAAGGRWMAAHFTGGGFCKPPAPTGYLNERGRDECPMIMQACYMDRNGNTRGVVRDMRSPQDEINKRRSKALHRLSTKQVVAEQGTVPSPEEARVELARPDGWITVNEGRMGGLQIVPGQDLTQIELGLLQEAKGEIDECGPSINVMAAPDSSGRAQQMRMKAASVPLEKVNDGLRSWTRRVMTATWHRVRQFWTYEKWMRVSDDQSKSGYRFVALNRMMTRAERLSELLDKKVPVESAITMLGADELGPLFGQILQQVQQQIGAIAQQNPGAPAPSPDEIKARAAEILVQQPVMQERLMTNQIDQLDVDILLDEVPDTTVVEQEQFEQLSLLAQKGIAIPPELIIEASQLRNKKRLLELLKQGPSPEQQQQAQQAQQIQMAQAQANLQKTQADTAKSGAQAQKTTAEIPLLGAQAEHHRATALYDGAAAGHMTVPDLLG